MNAEVQEEVQQCSTCNEAGKSVKFGSNVSTDPLPLPNGPWESLSIDLKGPMNNLPIDCRFAMVVVDDFSKWPEVKFTATCEAKHVIEFLEDIFNREGLPLKIRSDNGAQFISEAFKEFLRDNGIQHVRAPLFTPENNSIVERFNRTLSDQIEIARITRKPVKKHIQNFLQSYRATPHARTQLSPSLLLHGREMYSRMHEPKMIFERKREDKVTNESRNPYKLGEKVCVKHP